MSEALTHLPPKLAEIAELVGVADALKLSEAWPGQRLFVPVNMVPDHPIALCIGFKAARKLSEVYGLECIVVPMASRYLRALLRQHALAKYHAGATAAEVSREFGVHVLSLYRWASEAERERQGSLL